MNIKAIRMFVSTHDLAFKRACAAIGLLLNLILIVYVLRTDSAAFGMTHFMVYLSGVFGVYNSIQWLLRL